MSELSKIDQWVEEYKPLKGLYGDFAHAVRFILENLLNRKGFNYQVVTCREKSEASLRDKLRKKDEESSEGEEEIQSLTDIKDLAGCRIIFYLDSDIKNIADHDHLYTEFEVIDRKLHYSDNGHNALHFTIKLNDNRAKLSEYERFKDLKCEIQLMTTLCHTWSELAHDTIYKIDKNLSEFHKPAFESIKKLFSKVMENHIKPAQYDLNFIFYQVERIKQGKKVFDIAELKSIVDSNSNNEIYQKLEYLLSSVREFRDKTPEELNVIETINHSLKQSKRLIKEPVNNTLDNFLGYDYIDIAEICLNILEYLGLNYPKEIFKILCQLSIEDNYRIQKRSSEVAAEMAGYTFIPEKKIIYFRAQLIILDEIEKLDDGSLLTYLNLLTKVSSQMLSPSFKGVSQDDYQTVNFLQGALPTGDTVKTIRQKAFNILKKLYALSETISDKVMIIQALDEATRTPNTQDYTPELENMILGDTNKLILYYTSIVQEANNEITRTIDEQVSLYERRFPRGLRNLTELKSLIKENTEYNIYKVLVGWDRDLRLGYEEAKQEREQKIDEYIKQINEQNFSLWQKRILSIAETYELYTDLSLFSYFNFFLRELGKQKPEIAHRLILQNEQELESFLLDLVTGIWQSNE